MHSMLSGNEKIAKGKLPTADSNMMVMSAITAMTIAVATLLFLFSFGITTNFGIKIIQIFKIPNI